MTRTHNRIALWTGMLLLTLSGLARAVEVKLQVSETAGVARTGGAVTMGVPFAQGQLADVGKLSARVGGKAVPAQFIRTVAWPDGSVRWALMDVQLDVPAGGKVELVVSDDGGNVAPAHPVKVDRGPDGVAVSTGPLQFVVSTKSGRLFDSIRLDGKPMLSESENDSEKGRGIVIYKDGGGQALAAAPTKVEIEQAGPMRTIVCVRGRIAGVHNNLLGYTARITALAGQRRIKVHLWLENDGAMGYREKETSKPANGVEWFAFEGMAVELGLNLGQSVKASCEGVSGDGQAKFKVLQTCRQTTGQDRNKRPPFYTWTDMGYSIINGEEALKTGDRTDGVVELAGPDGRMVAAIRHFWQNYDKAIELDGRTLRLWLWPDSGQWPRARDNLHHNSLYDKTIEQIAREGLYLLPGGVHKGHEFVLDFSAAPANVAGADLSAPLMALASGEYYASTEAAPGVFAPAEVKLSDRESTFRIKSWERMTRSIVDPECPNGLIKARQYCVESSIGYFRDSTYWFGWMDFGDLQVPGRGQVSLHYDWPWLMMVSAMRTGEPRYMELAGEMARHRVDIDQLWSDRDPVICNGLQRGDNNWPSFNCNRLYNLPSVRSNWLAGTVLYYMLTGEPKALEAARRNADGLAAAWAEIWKTQPYNGPQGDMAATGWTILSYCAMADLTGEQVWRDRAIELFDKNVVPKWQALGPFLHNPEDQIRSQDYVKEDMRYCYAIASLCELHRQTGNEQVFKLLSDACQKELPDSFFEAPLYLSNLFAYVGLKADNREYLDKAAELFSQGFPMSKCPPAFLPDNTTWSRQSAMMLRMGLLLQYAHWKKPPPAK